MLTSNLFLLIPIAFMPLFTYWLTTRQDKKRRDTGLERAGRRSANATWSRRCCWPPTRRSPPRPRRPRPRRPTTLSQIHALVNSNLTQAQERELAAARANLMSMREVITLKQDRGVPVLAETLEAMVKLEAQIEALSAELRAKHDALEREGALLDAAEAVPELPIEPPTKTAE